MVVNMHAAKSKLSELVALAEEGEEVVIARNGVPAVRLVRTGSSSTAKGKIQLGTLRHKLKLPENWEELFDEYGKELEDIMINGPIFPEEE